MADCDRFAFGWKFPSIQEFGNSTNVSLEHGNTDLTNLFHCLFHSSPSPITPSKVCTYIRFSNSFFHYTTRYPAFQSERLGYFSGLRQTRDGIPKFLPANREHCISRLAFRHDDSKLVPCSGKIVIRLIPEADLWDAPDVIVKPINTDSPIFSAASFEKKKKKKKKKKGVFLPPPL